MALAISSSFAALAVLSIALEGREAVIAIVMATFLRGRAWCAQLADVRVLVRAVDLMGVPSALMELP